MFSFQHIEYFLGFLIIAPLLILFFNTVYWKEKNKSSFGNKELIDRLIKNYSAKRYSAKFLLLCISIILLVIACADLRMETTIKGENKIGLDVIFALDISKSMWAEDAKPSRLDLAKQFLNGLVDQLVENRMGLVIFAGRPYLQSPLTIDASIIKMCLSNASPEAAPVQGTIISDALNLCNKSFDSKTKKYKTIILISDGEDHDDNIDASIQQLVDDGVVVNTIGVGTLHGATITEPGTNFYKKDVNGQLVISKLNTMELKNIASKTGGTFIQLEGNEKQVVDDLYKQINGMQKKIITRKGEKKSYASLFPFFLALSLLLLVAEIFISEIKK